MQSFILSKKALEAVMNFTAKDTIRPSLAWVYVNIDDEWKVTIACTDSFRLHEVQSPILKWKFPEYNSFMELKSEPKVVWPEIIESIVWSCKLAIAYNKQYPYILLWDKISIGGSIQKMFEIPDDNILVLPHKVMLNAQMLLSVLKLVDKYTQIQITTDTPSSAFKIEWSSNGTKHTHVVMPLKQ